MPLDRTDSTEPVPYDTDYTFGLDDLTPDAPVTIYRNDPPIGRKFARFGDALHWLRGLDEREAGRWFETYIPGGVVACGGSYGETLAYAEARAKEGIRMADYLVQVRLDIRGAESPVAAAREALDRITRLEPGDESPVDGFQPLAFEVFERDEDGEYDEGDALIVEADELQE